jgi:flagellar biosynthetic protein FliR
MWTDAALQGIPLHGFLLVLARVAGLVAALPVPGAKNMAEPARIGFVLALAVSLAPQWPAVRPAGPGQLTLWLTGELAFGLAVGLVAGFVAETLVFAAQSVALQAGFAYASTIDPASQADSSVLQVLSQLAANLLFFAAGLDHAAIRAIARSLEAFPPGSAWDGWSWLPAVQAGGAAMLELGLRLALPVAGLLLLADLALALCSRLQAQLQLLSMAFPLKMLLALTVLAAAAPLTVWIHRAAAAQALAALRRWGLH